MRVVVPFDAVEPKTRLSPLLDAEERAAFARVLLEDVLDALHGAGVEPTVYATAPVDVDAPVVVDERGLDPLVNGLLSSSNTTDRGGSVPDASPPTEPLAVVMADLGLAAPPALERLFATDGDVVLAPGRGGGTNALVIRDPAFSVDFHGVSLQDHRANAREIDAELAEVDSARLSTDVDEPADVAEVLLHGVGRAPAWLRERGFEVSVTDGRADVVRRV